MRRCGWKNYVRSIYFKRPCSRHSRFPSIEKYTPSLLRTSSQDPFSKGRYLHSKMFAKYEIKTFAEKSYEIIPTALLPTLRSCCFGDIPLKTNRTIFWGGRALSKAFTVNWELLAASMMASSLGFSPNSLAFLLASISAALEGAGLSTADSRLGRPGRLHVWDGMEEKRNKRFDASSLMPFLAW